MSEQFACSTMWPSYWSCRAGTANLKGRSAPLAGRAGRNCLITFDDSAFEPRRPSSPRNPPVAHSHAGAPGTASAKILVSGPWCFRFGELWSRAWRDEWELGGRESNAGWGRGLLLGRLSGVACFIHAQGSWAKLKWVSIPGFLLSSIPGNTEESSLRAISLLSDLILTLRDSLHLFRDLLWQILIPEKGDFSPLNSDLGS